MMADENVNESHGYKHCSGYGVDAVLDISVETRPFCEHGPTVLFERFFKDKPSRKFFACSACRDRKQCVFFQWQDEKLTEGKMLIQKEIKKKLFKKKAGVTRLVSGDSWCNDCACGFSSDRADEHDNHTSKILTQNDVTFPTQFINPSEGKKSKAQYFFDEETCQLFIKTIKRLQYKNVVCIGTPRLFELLRGTDVSVILLDIDSRFEYFYSPDEFFKYNMFTHFFFDKGAREKTFETFISKCVAEETMIVMDPPFGGLLDVLQQTLSKIWKLFSAESVPTMMIFPYFLENHVSRSLPSLLLHDYKVSYSNHPTYRNNNDGKQSRGSPVRIYTNIPGSKLSFPTEDYRFCKICQRYVYKANRHCKECNACTSKDGRTYVHCAQCKACVKPTNVHCATCKSCRPSKHRCDANNVLGCHICGELDHKRKDCPCKEKKENCDITSVVGEKRKFFSAKGDKMKKKKKSLK